MSVYIIAEAGVNHNGSYELAKKMVEVAQKCGADAIKFQTFQAEKLVIANSKKAEYQVKNTGNSESQLSMLKKLQLSQSEFLKLKDDCETVGIEFLSTPFDIESLDFLKNLEMKRWKIPSGEITNLPYLIRIAKTQIPVILSTGMATLEEVDKAVNVLKKYGTQELTLLHCTTEYPTLYEDVNLNAMITMQKFFNLPVGYSDHTMGVEIPIAAVAIGASIIEKHFTLDRNMAGPDHKASLEPDELSAMVKAIKHVERSMGNGIKKPAESERKNIIVVRKSIVAKMRISKGEILSDNNLTVKRPGTGVSPMNWFDVIGTSAVRNFEEDEFIEI
ncbi:N-acetylneuraminate synthase [Eubacteriaceae bacterium ES2]|nr:N-acetylneuraminate synthase [Eubacteriaceae bacterium ES2]